MYKWAKIEEDAVDVHYFEHGDGNPVTVDELKEVEQFEIVDPDGDQIAVVYSQTDAEALVSHLNR
uniref:DUF2283 domain-containing protein n=1 Tax=Burkholderia phage vB_BgluM-SURPRISE13 TaxID=3159457 RepID=A0AAU7PFG8_9VIRU